jgi:hypothetical protein
VRGIQSPCHERRAKSEEIEVASSTDSPLHAHLSPFGEQEPNPSMDPVEVMQELSTIIRFNIDIHSFGTFIIP